MKSKKKLFEFLDAYYCIPEPHYNLNHPQISNETYGRKSCIYINCGEEMRGNLRISLEANGFKVDRRYGEGYGRLEVQVSYFKGDRYWE
jgi:hypothetical protein